MADLSGEWDDYKQAVLRGLAGESFHSVYGDLEGQKPSGDGFRLARCPLHDDHDPSFGYSTTTGQWECFAGCGKGSVFDFLMRRDRKEFKEVLLEQGEKLGIPPLSGNNGSTVTYDYRDEAGQLLSQVIRRPGKKWRQRQPDGNGGWKWNLKGVRRVLYRLPDLISRPDERVFVVEGEKDADRLAGQGLLATTNPGGAGKWHSQYNESMKSRDIVIITDNDMAGRDHAQQIAASLYGIAQTVKITDLPGLATKGDVSDWLTAGHTVPELLDLVAQTPAWSPESEVVDSPIIINERQQRDVIADAWSAVHRTNDPPSLFVKSRKLVRLVVGECGPRIELVDEAAVYGHLLRVATWGKFTRERFVDATPPKEVARDLLVNPDPELPILESVITTPVFDARGRLVTEPGYHYESRLWYQRPDGFELADIPECPTESEVEDAVALLREDMLVDFPFTSESDEAHTLAALLLPFARRLIPGCAPIHLIESPTPGSGKSLLADLISIIAKGRPCEPTTVSGNREETRKKITALLASGTSLILLDNVDTQLNSSDLASAITADVWKDRILGQTRMIQLQNRATWIVTANNPRLSLEIARRSIRIRIEPHEERPWERKEFKHDPIRKWALYHRRELIRAILVLVQSWLAAGRPVGKKSLGSFEDWASVIGGILAQVGVKGFLDDTDEFYEAADPEGQQWRAFIEVWKRVHSTEWVTTKELHNLASDHDMLGFVLGDKSERSQKTRLGRTLGTMRDRRFGDYKICVGNDKHSRQARYRLIPVAVELFPSGGEATE